MVANTRFLQDTGNFLASCFQRKGSCLAQSGHTPGSAPFGHCSLTRTSSLTSVRPYTGIDSVRALRDQDDHRSDHSLAEVVCHGSGHSDAFRALRTHTGWLTAMNATPARRTRTTLSLTRPAAVAYPKPPQRSLLPSGPFFFFPRALPQTTWAVASPSSVVETTFRDCIISSFSLHQRRLTAAFKRRC